MTINGPDDYLAVKGDDAMAKVLAGAIPFFESSKNNLPVIETPRLDKQEHELVCPAAALEGDYVACLVQQLSRETSVPPQFLRENAKTILGTVHNGRVGFPRHTNLSARQYCFH